MAKSESPDEMQHYAAFHQGLNFLLRLKQPSRTEIHQALKDLSMTPTIQLEVPFLLYHYVWETSPEYKGLMWYCSQCGNAKFLPVYMVMLFPGRVPFFFFL